MKKIVITLSTDADIMGINYSMQKILQEILNEGLRIREYTIQEAKGTDIEQIIDLKVK